MPERLFQKYPTLRGARIDHPFRSRLPRYTLAQDHPIAVEHYRAAIGQLVRAVPDLSTMSVWTNDSGAGFEHTASLYVGRNGGPYMIREWRNHDKVAAAAGASIARFLKNLQSAAAAVNPDFDVLLRIEPFKVEHEHIKAALGGHVGWEAPSLMVKGYHVPYNHPRYPEQAGVGGSIFQPTMDPGETEALKQTRAQGVEPVLYYSPGPVMNQEPLLGIPFPAHSTKNFSPSAPPASPASAPSVGWPTPPPRLTGQIPRPSAPRSFSPTRPSATSSSPTPAGWSASNTLPR